MSILDDGCGMSEAELVDAMRIGSRSPREDREASDLGRFGLGLKTASISQARSLTVATHTAAAEAPRPSVNGIWTTWPQSVNGSYGGFRLRGWGAEPSRCPNWLRGRWWSGRNWTGWSETWVPTTSVPGDSSSNRCRQLRNTSAWCSTVSWQGGNRFQYGSMTGRSYPGIHF